MKKLLFILIVGLLLSCQKENDAVVENNIIVGTWVEYASDRDQYPVGTVSFESEHYTFVFTASNTGLFTEEGLLAKNGSEKIDFTYTIDFDTNRLIIKFLDESNEDDTWSGSFIIKDNNTIEWDGLILHKKLKTEQKAL